MKLFHRLVYFSGFLTGVLHASAGTWIPSTPNNSSWNDPANENRVWIAGTTWSSNSDAPNTGVYETTDGCKTWHSITGDIGYRKPIVLRYNATTKELWAAGPAAFKLKR